MKIKHTLEKPIKSSKKRKVVITVISIIVVLFAVVFIGTNYYLSRINYTPLDEFGLLDKVPPDETDGPNANTDNNPKPIAKTDNNPKPMQFASGKVLSNDENVRNILFIGSDTRGGEEYGRSDSMLILSIDKNTKQIKLTSLMRDMYLKIDGIQDNRINVAYAYGGPKLLIETIQNNFKVKIDNYIRVDFKSFTKVIDLIGGVEINLTEGEAQIVNSSGNSQRVTAGNNILNGANALVYSRIRNIDSDFERSQRQRNVISSVLDALKKSNPLKIMNILNEVLPLVQTDLNNGQILSLTIDSFALRDKPLLQCRLPADGTYQSSYIRGMFVFVPNIEENKKILWKFIYNHT